MSGVHVELVSRLMEYEDGELDAIETLDLFADLIRTGTVWSLQGSYGRTADAMIRNGLVTPEGVVTSLGRQYAEGVF